MTVAPAAQGTLGEQIEGNEPGQRSQILRLLRTPEIQVRARGPRDIDEIPLGELRASESTFSEICEALDLPEDDERVQKRLQAAGLALQ
jgi:hypothetical protein